MPTRKKQYGRTRKTTYRIRNWSQYNQALKERGNLNIWVSDEALTHWYAQPTSQPGRQRTYSELAIKTALTVRKLFRLPYRQTCGFLESLIQRSGFNLTVPDYSTLSRRGCYLTTKLPKKDKPAVDIVIDSTGVKVYGAGEWNTKRQGKKKAKRWKKIHIGIDDDGEIRVGEVTEESTDDAAMMAKLLSQERATIHSVKADGAYDKRKVYLACQANCVKQIVIPPRRDARIWRHGNKAGPPHPRDENLRLIRRHSKRHWQKHNKYHQRSLVENTMFRYKTILGDRVLAREDSRQQTELKLGFVILNRMFQLGRPDSYAVTV